MAPKLICPKNIKLSTPALILAGVLTLYSLISCSMNIICYNQLMVSSKTMRLTDLKQRTINITIALLVTFGLVILGAWLVFRQTKLNSIQTSMESTHNQAYIINSDENYPAKRGEDNIGKLRIYTFNNSSDVAFSYMPFYVADVDAVQDFLDIDLTKVPANKIPIIASTNSWDFSDSRRQSNWLEKEFTDKYYIVGVAPISASLGQPILVDDGSSKIGDYISNLAKNWQDNLNHQDDQWVDVDRPYRLEEYAVSKFDNPKDVLNYEAITLGEVFGSEQIPRGRNFIGDALDIAGSYRLGQTVLFIIVIIYIFTCLIIALVLAHFYRTPVSKNHAQKNSTSKVYASKRQSSKKPAKK